MVDESLSPVGETTPGRILIVDDIADNRTILGRRFERRGYEIIEAESGQGALDAIARQTFDVVLLDVMMPDINGFEVLRRIREQYSDVALPVIMVTGKTDSEDIVQALTLGANDYITKPVDFAVALARVSTQAGRRQAEEQVLRANAALSQANEDLERRIAERTAELVRTNDQLRLAMGEAQAANKAKDEFLVIVSHELRTPLNGLVAMGQMLDKTELDARQRRMAGLINSSAAQLHDVVADLLDTLDLSAGGLTLSPTLVDLAALVAEAAAPAAAEAAAKGLAFKVEVSDDALAPVRVDAQRLHQVLGKLLDNGVKFTEVGEVSLTVTRAGGVVAFEVRDTGVGFEPDSVQHLFRPFAQADGSLTRRFGGVGLGLAICHGLVQLMGGRICADGRPNGGASFRVVLPLAAVAAKAA
jgi:signal transduction histidine kinase